MIAEAGMTNRADVIGQVRQSVADCEADPSLAHCALPGD